MEKPKMDNEIQVDFLEILKILRRRFFWILIVGLLCAAGFGAVSKYLIEPEYTSSAMLYVLSKEATMTSLSDLQAGSQLTKDYKVMITSRPVLQEVIEDLGLTIDYKDLRKKITVTNPADTRILMISLIDSDPEMAKLVVDEVAKASAGYISDIMEMVPPKLIEDGEVAVSPTAPSTARNTVLGGLLGIMLMSAVFVAQLMMNDTIKQEEDVEKYLGLSVLASLPVDKTKKVKKRGRR